MSRFKISSELRNGAAEIFSSKPALIVYACILAIMTWFLFAINIYPDSTSVIKDIKLEVRMPEATGEDDEYVIEEQDVNSVNITIKAPRSIISNLNSSDFKAVADLSSVTETGDFESAINITCSRSNANYTLENISSSTVNVSLDKVVTKTINAEADAPNIKVAEGYLLDGDSGVCTPSTLNIKGPSKLVNEISVAKVSIETSKEITTSYTSYSDKIVYKSDSGAEIESEQIDSDVDEFLISFDVLKEKELGLTYQLQNEPAGFDEDFIRDRISLSADTINVAGSGSELEDLDKLDIGSVSLNEIGLDFSKSMNITLSDGIRNVSGLNSVSMEFDDSDLASKDIVISEFSVTNTPTGYTDFAVTTDSITVTVIGPEKEIEELSAQDITATINLMGYKVQSYEFDYDVTLSFGKYNHIWSTGTYKAAVTCSADTASAEIESSED